MSIQQNQIPEVEAMPTVLVRHAEANDIEGIVRLDLSGMVQDLDEGDPEIFFSKRVR